MKLYEFVDKLYAIGDMEAPKTIRSKKTLNESIGGRRYSIAYCDKSGIISDHNKFLVTDLDDGAELDYNDLCTIIRGVANDMAEEDQVDTDTKMAEFVKQVLIEMQQPTTDELSTIIVDLLHQNMVQGFEYLFDENLTKDDLDEEFEDEEELQEDKDLSTVKGSMTQILQDNREKIDACGSAKEVYDTVAGLLAEAGLDTPATRRLLLTLKKQKRLTDALQAVYNSILKGSDLGVIKEAANANPPRYQVKGCGKNGRVENHDQFMIFDSEYNDEIDYYDLCEIIRDINEDNDLSSSQVEDIATDVISELYFQTPDEDLGEIISMYSY